MRTAHPLLTCWIVEVADMLPRMQTALIVKAIALTLGSLTLAIAWPLIMLQSEARSDSAFDPPPLTSVAIYDYLLGMDFVVIGRVPADYDPTSPFLTIRVTKTILGALPHAVVTLAIPFARPTLGPHAEVVAWGNWESARGDTCYGNALSIDPSGSMRPRIGRVKLLLDGLPLEVAGSYARMLHRLDERGSEHSTKWLESGSAILLGRVTTVNAKRGVLTVAAVRVLVGVSDQAILHIRWHDSPLCGLSIAPGDSIVIATLPDKRDTIEAPICLERMRLKGRPYLTPVGVRIDQVHEVFEVRDNTLRVQSIHGVSGN